VSILCNVTVEGSNLWSHALRLAYLAAAYFRRKRTLAPSDSAKDLVWAILPSGHDNLEGTMHSQLALALLTRAEE